MKRKVALEAYAQRDSVGCFVAGTQLQIDNEEEFISIQDVKVGDRMLSKPENGFGDNEYKPVLNTFVHKNKPIWLVKTIKDSPLNDKEWSKLDKQYTDLASEYITHLFTPNHPMLVVGGADENEHFQFYNKPQWKRVDELQRDDLLLSPGGVSYAIESAQPVYRFAEKKGDAVNPNIYWYQKNYNDDFDEFYEDYYNSDDHKPNFNISKEEHEYDYKTAGYVFNINEYIESGYIMDQYSGTTENPLVDVAGNYIPFTYDVHHIEVADNHTYYAGAHTGLLVHQ